MDCGQDWGSWGIPAPWADPAIAPAKREKLWLCKPCLDDRERAEERAAGHGPAVNRQDLPKQDLPKQGLLF